MSPSKRPKCPIGLPNVLKWLEDIDIWDEKYDYVMHDEHCFISKWSPDCQKCREADAKKKSNETYDLNVSDLNGTLYRSALENTITSTPYHKQPMLNSKQGILPPPRFQPQLLNSRIPKKPVALPKQSHL